MINDMKSEVLEVAMKGARIRERRTFSLGYGELIAEQAGANSAEQFFRLLSSSSKQTYLKEENQKQTRSRPWVTFHCTYCVALRTFPTVPSQP